MRRVGADDLSKVIALSKSMAMFEQSPIKACPADDSRKFRYQWRRLGKPGASLFTHMCYAASQMQFKSNTEHKEKRHDSQ